MSPSNSSTQNSENVVKEKVKESVRAKEEEGYQENMTPQINMSFAYVN